ncbi:MAG: DUF4367 domain-containing protein [Clostridia bacterium]|nr:DUF4367 domain-containing protein [Clostridia bacterium]
MNEQKGRDMTVFENDEFCDVINNISAAEGQRLVSKSETLGQSGFRVSERLDERCLRIIRGEKDECTIRAKRKHKIGMALIAALIAVLMLFSAYAIFPQVREKINNIFYKTTQRYTEVSLANEPIQNTSLPTVRFTYVPDGFELIREYEGYAFYQNDNGDSFYLSCKQLEKQKEHGIDTEDAVVEELTVNGHNGLIIRKYDSELDKDRTHVIWTDVDRNHIYRLFITGVDSERIDKILAGMITEYGEEETE